MPAADGLVAVPADTPAADLPAASAPAAAASAAIAAVLAVSPSAAAALSARQLAAGSETWRWAGLQAQQQRPQLDLPHIVHT